MGDDNGLPGGYFGAFKYSSDGQGSYIDSTQTLANTAHMVVSFQHEPSGKAVFFKAFISAFNESYSSDWVAETVFGRSDPIQHFKQTTRRISLGVVIPAATNSEAYENLGRVQSLAQFLYPNYTKVNSGTTLTQNPLVRLKVMNLARHVEKVDMSTNPSNADLYKAYQSTSDAGKGLLGVITSLNVVHNLDNPNMGVIAKGANTVLPKAIEINLDFTVIHEELLGWLDNGKGLLQFNSPTFPYGVQLSDTHAALPQGEAKLTPEEAKKNEQARIAGDVRYGVAWGEARYGKDKKWLADYESRKEGTSIRKINAAVRSGDLSGLSKNEKYLAKNRANYRYLSSTTEGVEASAGGSDKVSEYLD